MRRIVMRQHSPLAACLYDIQRCFYQWSLMIFAFISGWKEFFDCFPLLVCQTTFVICCFIRFFSFLLLYYFFAMNTSSEDYTIEALKTMVWRYFMSYWSNRRICSAIGGIPPAVKRRRFYSALTIASFWPLFLTIFINNFSILGDK